MKKIIILFAMACWQTLSSANTGGGTVVGNGAGSVESNFQHAYYSISRIIPSCVAVFKCGAEDEEKVILAKIQSIVVKNANKKDRLVFLSEKLNPGFFTTGIDQNYRIAKTFLNSDSPIYLNLDMLYTTDGRPAINFQGMIRILIHELGHQTGIEEHAALDILGVKVSVYSEDHTSYYKYNIEEEKSNVTFSITNFDYPIKSSLVIFNWKDKKMEDLSNTIISSTGCSYQSESYAGLEVVNGHFDIAPNGTLSFQAWVDLKCYESFSTMTFTYRKDLTISLDQDYQIIGLKVK